MMNDSSKTKWIWYPGWNVNDKETARIVLFRKAFTAQEMIQDAELKISADTRYKIYVNGTFVQIGPSRGDFQVWFCDAVDIKPYLREGDNVIAVEVLRYPETPLHGNHGMFRTPTPGLYIDGSATDAAGNVIDLGTDETWKCFLNENISFIREEERFAPLYIHEIASGNEKLHGWKSASYDDLEWEYAKTYMRDDIADVLHPGNLKLRTIPFMDRKSRTFCGVMDIKKSVYGRESWNDFFGGKGKLEIPAHSEEIVEINAGEEMTGFIHAGFEGGAGAKIRILYSEAYVQEGVDGYAQLPVKADRTDYQNGHLKGYEDVYTVAGMGNETVPETYDTYWFRTFRFVKLHISTADEPLVIRNFDYEETGYPLEVATSVETSDETHKAIWEISERTLRRCMHESYEDCPFYEQLQYIMDSRQEILYTYAVSADDRLARKCMDDLRRSQRHDGLLNASYPNCTANIIPGFSIYYILMVYDHMMYFGDKELVEEHMPTIVRILDFFERNLTQEGYLKKVGDVIRPDSFWSFIDWAKEWDETNGMPTAGKHGSITMESLLYIYGLMAASKLNEYIGRYEDAKQMTERAEKVRAAVQKYCVGANGMIQDGPGLEEYSQQCQVFAILTDTVDMETGRANLFKTIQDKKVAQCTVAMSFYLFRAMEKAGLYEYTDQCWNKWREMVENHCTTCVEGDTHSRSECHAWGSLILYELPTITLGVRSAEAGYSKILIKPVPGYLTHAEGTVKTPVGDVYVSWELKDGECVVDYRAPEGVEVIRE